MKKNIFFIIIIFSIFTLFSFSCASNIPVAGNIYAGDNQANIDTLAMLNSMELTFNQVAEKILPVVVKVNILGVEEDVLPWDFYFGDPEEDPGGRDFENFNLGSGVIVEKVDKKVYILTNNHVIKNAKEITITLNDNREFPAQVVGNVERIDIAVLVFETDQDVAVATLGDSDKIKVGDWAMAVGNPFGWQSTITVGIISALGRKIDTASRVANFSDFIQTDAEINPGNSGGALVNLKGEVIGINTWITTPTGGSIGLGFALPINNVKKTINDLITKGKVEYGYLGVHPSDIPSAELAEDLDIKDIKGAFIDYVIKDTPADRGGLFPGDYIIKVDDKDVEDFRQFTLLIGDLPAGEVLDFQLIRLGKKINLSIVLDIRPDKNIDPINIWPGMVVVPLNKSLRDRFDLDQDQEGLIIAGITSSTPAGNAGFTRGDVIFSINGKSITNAKAYFNAINNKNKNELVFIIQRQAEQETITLIR